MKGAMAPLERKKNLNVVNDTRSACPPKKKKTLISIFSKINNDHKVDVEMIIVI